MPKSVSGSKRHPFPSTRISLTDMTKLDGSFRYPRESEIIEEDSDFLADSVSPKTLDFLTHDSSDDENKMQEDGTIAAPKPLQRHSPSTTSTYSSRVNILGVYPSLHVPRETKPLLLGGQKRDISGRCVSEAVLKLSLKDNGEDSEDSPVQRKKLASQKTSPYLQTSSLAKIQLPLKSVNGSKRIGDHSQAPLLPMIRSGKHPDLKCVSASTLGCVIRREICKDDIEQMWIVDCRYPFEFNAGHIQGAINLYHRGDLRKHFLDNPYQRKDLSKRHLVVFHCEFSSKRGPDQLRFLRAQDREMNHHCYPNLAYPELYLLDGGYKAFFEVCQDLCEPRFYTPMATEAHKDEVSHCKAKAKTFHDFRTSGSNVGPRSKRF